jgi:glucans biosynthesis protein C
MALEKVPQYKRHSRGASYRQDDLDNLRSFLTALMIVHHTAIAYGGAGAWTFKSRCFPAFSPVLTAFNAINQTFFMGMFFFLSGFFARQSLKRGSRSKKDFLRSRLLRLGVPTVLYTLILEPALEVLVQLFDPSRNTKVQQGQAADIFWSYWSELRGIKGPVWYLAIVIIFDIITVVIAPAQFGNFLERVRSLNTKILTVPILWAVNVVTSFAIRLIYPVNRVFTPLNLRPAFLPQYILAYTCGHASALLNDRFVCAPFPALAPPLMDLVCSLSLSIVGLVALIAVTMQSSSSVPTSMEYLMGGFNLPAVLYTVWNEVSFALIAPAVMRVFAKYVNLPIHVSFPGGLRGVTSQTSLARYSYAAFLVHTIVSAAVELFIEARRACTSPQSTTMWHSFAEPVLMTVFVGITNVLLSWFVGFLLVEYVHGLGKIV